MLAKYRPVQYELLRPAQVKTIREACPIAYIPAGSLEWHSFQNPLGCDSIKAHAVCCEAALRHGGVVLPPIYQGLLGDDNWGPAGWKGYTLGYNAPEVFERTVGGIARALVEAGWKVVVGVTGHDVEEQRGAMDRAILAATDGRGATGFAMYEGALHQPDAAIPFSMDHAAAWETSCMMYLAGDAVDLDALRTRQLSADEDFVMSAPEGIGGKNPVKYASAELGRRIVECMGELVGARAREAWREVGGPR